MANRLEKVFGDCPFKVEGGSKRGYVVYTLTTGRKVFGCKGVENGGCGRTCFNEDMLSLGRAEEIALLDVRIKVR